MALIRATGPGRISSAPSIVISSLASERPINGTPSSEASRAVFSEVGTPRTFFSSPEESNSPILLTAREAVEPDPSPTVMPLLTQASTAAQPLGRHLQNACARETAARPGLGPRPATIRVP